MPPGRALAPSRQESRNLQALSLIIRKSPMNDGKFEGQTRGTSSCN